MIQLCLLPVRQAVQYHKEAQLLFVSFQVEFFLRVCLFAFVSLVAYIISNNNPIPKILTSMQQRFPDSVFMYRETRRGRPR